MEFVGLARPVGAPPIPGHMANPNDGIRRSAFGEDLHNPAVRSFGSPNLDLFVGCGHSISKVESRSTDWWHHYFGSYLQCLLVISPLPTPWLVAPSYLLVVVFSSIFGSCRPFCWFLSYFTVCIQVNVFRWLYLYIIQNNPKLFNSLVLNFT